jgi:hypothetical protein
MPIGDESGACPTFKAIKMVRCSCEAEEDKQQVVQSLAIIRNLPHINMVIV